MEECRHCGPVTCRVRWQTFAGGGRHLRATCPHCNAFIRYLPQTPENVADAEPEPAARPGPGLFDGAG